MLDGNRPGCAGGNAKFSGRRRGQLLTCSQERGGEGSQASCGTLHTAAAGAHHPTRRQGRQSRYHAVSDAAVAQRSISFVISILRIN